MVVDYALIGGGQVVNMAAQGETTREESFEVEKQVQVSIKCRLVSLYWLIACNTTVKSHIVQ